MKRFLFALAFVVLCRVGTAEQETGERFVIELSKSQVFQGESLSANFVLYVFDDRIDAEVAKFPEFRGFWSENTALRQGQMMTMPEARFPGLRKVVLGTYLLTPMMGVADPKITPLKLVLRRGLNETSLSSEVPPLKVLPLPPVPTADKPYFNGAVGAFTLRNEASVVRFFPKEPMSLRFFLGGVGNFQELNTLPLKLPEGMQLVSQRATILGSANFATKSFEFVLTVDSEKPLEFPPVRLVVFNPVSRRYETLTSDPLRLEPLPRPADLDRREALDFGPVEETPGAAVPLDARAGFWILQGLLALVWVSWLGARAYHAWRDARANDPWLLLKARWRTLLEDPGTDAEAWLTQAERLAFDTVQARNPLPFTTRREALAFARRHFDASTVESLESLLRAWETARFSPQRTAPPPRSQWNGPLKALRAALLRRSHRRRKTQEPA